ncbi:MAG: MogA/MoaB family molybdenum cofactor biosynthesis protein [Chloroflexia bacterium]
MEAGYTIAILTVSDRSSRGEREDRSGPAVREAVSALPQAQVVAEEVVPDEVPAIEEALRRWVRQGVDLVLTTGGTGFSPRDVTPEATRRVIEREAPGLAEAMRAASLSRTPHAMLSRAVAGIAGRTLIVNLPGSPRAARENLEVILPALPHGLSKLRGDPGECGGETWNTGASGS